MHDLQQTTSSALETALEFAIEAEERMNVLCQFEYDHSKPANHQTSEVENLLQQWRNQKEICERLAKLLWNMNPDFKDERFCSADLRGNGVSHLLTYSERLKIGRIAFAKAVSKS